MSVYITGINPGKVTAGTIGTTVTVHIGGATVSFDNVTDARRWVSALDRAVAGLEVQQRGVAA